jgi:RNA polymerase primary sigma factor
MTNEEQERCRALIDTALKRLSYREREILKLRYGLGNGVKYTLEEVGHIFRVSRERIRQLEKQGIAKLGKLLDTDPQGEELKRLLTEAIEGKK